MRLIRLLLLLLLLPLAGAGAAASSGSAASHKRIALTFDDIPRNPGAFYTPAERTERLIAALREAGVAQAAFFVTTGNLEQPFGQGGAERIAAYVRAGHVLANHTHSHRHLSEMNPEDYVADLDRAATWLSGRPGFRPWFRYPFLDEGHDTTRRDAVRAALASRKLLNGYVTADSYDWYLDQQVVQAKQQGKPVDLKELRKLYVDTVTGAAEFQDRVARKALGRSPAHVLLLHETDLSTRFIADAVAALRKRGWEIVSADEAFADPISGREPNTLFLGGGRIAALANEAGRPARELAPEWNEEAFLSRRFAKHVLHEKPKSR